MAAFIGILFERLPSNQVNKIWLISELGQILSRVAILLEGNSGKTLNGQNFKTSAGFPIGWDVIQLTILFARDYSGSDFISTGHFIRRVVWEINDVPLLVLQCWKVLTLGELNESE